MSPKGIGISKGYVRVGHVLRFIDRLDCKVVLPYWSYSFKHMNQNSWYLLLRDHFKVVGSSSREKKIKDYTIKVLSVLTNMVSLSSWHDCTHIIAVGEYHKPCCFSGFFCQPQVGYCLVHPHFIHHYHNNDKSITSYRS